MKSILTKDEIREVCLTHGFSLKQQPNGEMDLNPYVYHAAAALVERGLKATLISRDRNLRTILDTGPAASVEVPNYTDVCPQFVRDHQKLWVHVEALQGSLVLRKISSTNLYNGVVVDKHDKPLAFSMNKPLGAAMHDLIEQTIALVNTAQSVPNEPIFPKESIDGLVLLGDYLGKITVAAELIKTVARKVGVPATYDGTSAIELEPTYVKLNNSQSYALSQPAYDYDDFEGPDFHNDHTQLLEIATLLDVPVTVDAPNNRPFRIRVGSITVCAKTVCGVFSAALALVTHYKA